MKNSRTFVGFILQVLLLATAGCPHDFPRFGGDGASSGDYSLGDGVPAGCGDGKISGAEVCDGAAIGGKTCKGLGFSGGTLACARDCRSFDVSGCTGCCCGVSCSNSYLLFGSMTSVSNTSVSGSYKLVGTFHSTDRESPTSNSYVLSGRPHLSRP